MDGGQPWRHTFGDNLTYTDWRRGNFYRALRALLVATTTTATTATTTTTATRMRVGVEFDVLTLEQKANLDRFLPSVEMVNEV